MKVFTLAMLPKRVLAELSLETSFMASMAVVVAERFQIFRELGRRKLSVTSIAKMIDASPRYLGHLLDGLVALGLLNKSGNLYQNTALSSEYFVIGRTINWTRRFSSECVEYFEAIGVLEKVIRHGKNCTAFIGKKRQDYVESMKRDPERARDFTLMLYDYHQTDAKLLARALDLRLFRSILDVGGGSGVMSIALVRKNPRLKAVILDIEPVCKVAGELIEKGELSRRINTAVGDIHDDLPKGHDVILFCDVGQIHGSMVRRAFASLPSRGMLVLVDRFLSSDKTKPIDRVLHQLIGSSFGSQTRDELRSILKSCGFKRVKSRHLGGGLWLIRGSKP